MGVSGFLISCAMRRATSCHASVFWERSNSDKSSKTSTKPVFARRGPRELTVTARCSTRPPATASISRDTTPMRRDRRIKCWTVCAESAPSNSSRDSSPPASIPNMRNGRIDTQNGSRTVQRDHSSRNIFKHGFHQLPPPLKLLHSLLQAAGELIDLCPAVAQLGRHGVERAHQHPKFVLSLFRDLIIKVAGRDFAGAFRERLDRNRDLLGKKQRHPHDGRQQENGKQQKDEKHLALEGTQILFGLIVFAGLRLNGGEARQHARARAVSSHNKPRRFSFFEARHARAEIIFPFRLPNLHAALERTLVLA